MQIEMKRFLLNCVNIIMYEFTLTHFEKNSSDFSRKTGDFLYEK